MDLIDCLDERIDAARQWLMSSGIQTDDGEHFGGVHAWYDENAEAYSHLYPEISGYYITSSVFIGTPKAIEQACHVVEWIRCKAAHPRGGVLTHIYHVEAVNDSKDVFHREALHTFDAGMILNGVMNLYACKKDPEILEVGVDLADFLMDLMQKPDGTFYALLLPDTGKRVDNETKWSRQSGSYHSKLAIGFLLLHEVTGQARYLENVRKICEASLRFQTKEGRFITCSQDQSTHAHPHCYSMEGLYVAGCKLNEKRYLDACVRGYEWLTQHQRRQDKIAALYVPPGKLSGERADALAQTLRIGALLTSRGLLSDTRRKELEKLLRNLFDFQRMDGKQRGGFRYGKTEAEDSLCHLNAWVTMFAFQAMTIYRDWFEKKLSFPPELLV